MSSLVSILTWEGTIIPPYSFGLRRKKIVVTDLIGKETYKEVLVLSIITNMMTIIIVVIRVVTKMIAAVMLLLLVLGRDANK